MQSMVQKRFLILPPPGDGDNQADLDRLTLALRDEFGPVRVPLDVLLRDANILRASGYRATATLVREDSGWTLARVQPGDAAARRYGLACDLGSTTVAVQLIDLNAGTAAATRTAVNAQVARGADILTRIFYTREPGQEAARRAELQRLAVQTIDGLISGVLADAGVDPADCPLLIVAGNTTMIHFLLGVDAFCVFSAPFAPMFNRAPAADTRALGFGYEGRLYCFPSAANYLGGDILSGLWSTGLADSDELSLFIDIGTNGEMALGCRDFLIAGAGAAGPALEGGISKNGMRAAPGAVDRVRIEGGKLTVTTIDGAPPRGICGSGIVDLLAEMRRSGWLNVMGRLEPGASERIVSVPMEHGEGEEWAVVYARDDQGAPLTFTQSDIAQFSETKAAAGTMVACLLQAAGVEPGQVQRIYLAGAFGEHLDLESSILIGLYPDLPRDRFVQAGNASLSGARKLLLDRRGLERVEDMLRDLYYLEFAMQPNFLDLMSAARYYPPLPREVRP